MSENKSMVEVAYTFLASKKRPVAFDKLWTEVAKQTKASKDKISQFYSDLTLDGRFVSLKENKWDLKSRRKFEESQIDLKAIEIEDDEKEIFDEDGNVINDND